MNRPTFGSSLDATLDALLSYHSPSFAESELVDALELWLTELSQDAQHLEVIRLGDNLVARTHLGLAERLLLVGHTDTVPGSPQVSRDGEKVIGLGASDMKSGVAVFVQYFDEVIKGQHDVKYDLTLVLYAREEVAAKHSGLQELLDKDPGLLDGCAAVVGEPTDAVVELGCQGTLRAQAVFLGEAAHSARPWMGDNAIHKATSTLCRVRDYEPRRVRLGGCEFIESLQVVGIAGGGVANVVPDRCELLINHRFAPDRSVQEALDFVHEVLSDADSIEVLDVARSAPVDLNNKVLSELVRLSGSAPRAKLGWTDVARLAELGIAGVNFGPGDPLVAHKTDEFVSLVKVHKCYEVLVDLIGLAK